MENMKKIGLIFASICLSLAFTACDEGDIHESIPAPTSTGRVFKLSANIVGADTWPSQYAVVMACFTADDQAVMQKRLPEGASGAITEVMSLPDTVQLQTVELCVTNRLRHRVMTYAVADVPSQSGDTVRLDAGAVDLSMYSYIQTSIFTPLCATCHRAGSSTTLELAEGLSYESLVGHAANHAEDGVRVVPRRVSASLLHRVLSGDATTSVPFDHSPMLRSDQLELIDNWIKNL